MEIPQPTAGPYEVVVRSVLSFICNATDRKLSKGHFPGIGIEKCLLPFGHESAGIVESIGRRGASFKPGDHVVGGLLLKPTDNRYSSGWGGNSEYVIATNHTAMVADGVVDESHGWLDVFHIMLKVPERELAELVSRRESRLTLSVGRIL